MKKKDNKIIDSNNIYNATAFYDFILKDRENDKSQEVEDSNEEDNVSLINLSRGFLIKKTILSSLFIALTFPIFFYYLVREKHPIYYQKEDYILIFEYFLILFSLLTFVNIAILSIKYRCIYCKSFFSSFPFKKLLLSQYTLIKRIYRFNALVMINENLVYYKCNNCARVEEKKKIERKILYKEPEENM